MSLSTTFGSLHKPDISKGAATLFNGLGIYRFCIAFAVIDYVDVLGLLEYNDAIKYCYAAIIIGFMAIYFIRWKKIDATLPPIIFLAFFLITASAFVANYFAYNERQSYMSAFVAPLVFSVAIFIPPNVATIDARKIVRDLTFLLSGGAVFYLVEAIVKPLDTVSSLVNLHEVQVHKSLICVLALCLCILTGRNFLALFVAAVTLLALLLRPMSTLVLACICCLPIAIALRSRKSKPGPIAILLSRVIAMTTLLLAVLIPMLLYFYLDDVGALIAVGETYLKSNVLGAYSNMAFRLEILKLAFTSIDSASTFLFGSGLSNSLTVPLSQQPGFQYWNSPDNSGSAPIHSDFVIVFVLMGIIGYCFLSAAFFIVLKSRFREMSRRGLDGNSLVIQAISVIATLAIVIYCSDEPYLRYYSHANVVWMLLLISEVARKSKVVYRVKERAQSTVAMRVPLNRFRLQQGLGA